MSRCFVIQVHAQPPGFRQSSSGSSSSAPRQRFMPGAAGPTLQAAAAAAAAAAALSLLPSSRGSLDQPSGSLSRGQNSRGSQDGPDSYSSSKVQHPKSEEPSARWSSIPGFRRGRRSAEEQGAAGKSGSYAGGQGGSLQRPPERWILEHRVL